MTSFYYEPPSVHQDKEFKGDVSAAYAWGTQVVEVEVDTDTGNVRLLKVTAAHDVGRVLNRLGIEGQVEGGIVMGQGYALTENLIVDEGKIRNPNYRDYKLVTAPEIPEMDIAFIESMDGEGPKGAKGVGEAPAICMAAAIAAAIENATGVRITSLPFTPERVYRALHGALPPTPPAPRFPREAPHGPRAGAGAVAALCDPALRPARLARHPHRGRGRRGTARRPEPLHRRPRRRRRPAQLLHRAQRRQGSHRAQPEGPARPGAAAPADPRTRRRRLLLQHGSLALREPGHRTGAIARGPAGPDLGRHFGHGPRLPGNPRLRPRAAGHGRLHGGHRRARRPAHAHRHPGHRPQGGRRALRQRAAGPAGAQRNRPGQDDRRVDAAGGGLLADHGAAAARLRLPPRRVTRAGNEHRKFIPTNVYPTRDGYVFLAIGSDVQWRRFTAVPKFACVANEVRATNEGRHAERAAIHGDIAAVTSRHDADEILADLRGATIPATRIHDIRQARELPALRDKLTRTRMPDGRTLHMQPMAVDLPDASTTLGFPPRYGQHTTPVLAEAGLSEGEIRSLYGDGVVA
jgi:hypothetical protein